MRAIISALMIGVVIGALIAYIAYWYWRGGEGLVLEANDVAVFVVLLIGCFLFGLTGGR